MAGVSDCAVVAAGGVPNWHPALDRTTNNDVAGKERQRKPLQSILPEVNARGKREKTLESLARE
jgi:hypothetical protein